MTITLDVYAFAMLLTVVIIAAFYLWYARIIRRQNDAFNALSSVDVQLRLRSDFIPNLLKIARAGMDHEHKLIKDIRAIRATVNQNYNRNDPQALRGHLAAAGALSDKTAELMTIVEGHPELKSNQILLDTMQAYSEAEANVAAARRFYNAAVVELNHLVRVFPGTLIAAMAGVAAMPFFENNQAEPSPIDAGLLLGTSPEKRVSRSQWR